jgi:Lon protease-like protein
VDVELPLFPLSSVLFPGGNLALRIFEPRYLDLVRRCTRGGTGFGIVLLLEGGEVGVARSTAAIGTEASIIDFAMTDEGLLAITAHGGRRFEILKTRVQDDGLVVGVVRWLPEAPPKSLRAEHHLLSVLLARVMDKAGIDHEGAGKGDLADAAWVGWRLAEWLPLDAIQRQQLLELDDPDARLQLLVERLPDFQAD